jgi:PAS domain S-box-containing protein
VLDLTPAERKRSDAEHRVGMLERALAEAEGRLRDYLEVSSDWIWETDAALRFTQFSGRLREVSGVDPATLLGRSRAELMASADDPAARLHLADLAARRPFRDYAYPTRTELGTRWFKVSGKPVFGPDGGFRGYRGTGTDLTAEIEARRRAEELHARFAEAMESVPASVLLCDADDRIVMFNSITAGFFPRATRFLVRGGPVIDLIRAQAASGFVPEASGRVEEWLADRMRRHRDPRGFDVVRLYGDGRWVRIIERPTSDGGTIGIRVDVSDLKQHEEALARQSAFLQVTLDSISQGLAAYDGDLRLVAMNRKFVDMLELPDALSHPGSSFQALIRFNAERGEYGPVDAEATVADRVALVRRPEPHCLERMRHDGTVLEVRGHPMPAGGFVTTYTDVTERKRAEQALGEHAKELQRSNAELEQFAYIASHDLQEPLRMVASYCQLLQRRYKGKLDADADEFIGYAVEGAGRMQRMINDLLNYSRVGRRGGQFEPVAMQGVADAVLKNLELAIGDAGATVAIGELPTVQGDRTLLHQLLQNLVGNALKFRRDAPVGIEVSAERDGDVWRFRVADDGIGIEAEYLERIFLIFQRLHERGKYPGTGIGLAVCKKVVEHHGGRIWVESTPGQGSMFFFTLPAPDAPARSPS